MYRAIKKEPTRTREVEANTEGESEMRVMKLHGPIPSAQLDCGKMILS